MFLIILAILVVIGLFVGLGFGDHNFTVKSKKKNYDTNQMEDYFETRTKFGWKLGKLQLLAPLGLLFILFGMFTTLDATEVAVVTRFGKVQEVVYTPGLKIKSPLDKYNKYSLKIQEIRYDNVVHAEISSYSSDAQKVAANLTIQWKINALDAQMIYENFGGDIDNVRDRLSSLVVERAKSTLTGYDAEELIAQRATLSGSIEELIKAQILAGELPLPVTVIGVYLTNFAFEAAFEDAVEAKMIAEQDRLKAQTEKEIAIIRAEEVLATTILQADSALEKAYGEANALLAVAQAEASALSAKVISVARTLGFDIIETDVLNAANEVIGTAYDIDMTDHTQNELNVIFDYVEYIAYLGTWDGVLPEVMAGPDSLSLILPSTEETE